MRNIDAARQVLANKQAEEFDGVLLDTFTASTIVAVYNGVKDRIKAKFDFLTLSEVATICMKIAAKVSAR